MKKERRKAKAKSRGIHFLQQHTVPLLAVILNMSVESKKLAADQGQSKINDIHTPL